MDYPKHLYMTLYPNNSLIASQLEPEQFARHYTSGSSRHYSGKVIFARLDDQFRNDFFPLERILAQVQPHEDGRPKATKFVASYRVLEHVDLDAIVELYLVTQEGHCLRLDPAEHTAEHEADKVRLYAEIVPLRMIVMSDFDFPTFGEYITDSNNPKSAPTQFYTQLDVDLPEFISTFEQNPFVASPIANVHPSTLRDGFNELKRYPNKHNKGIALHGSLEAVSYKIIRHGFMFSSPKGNRFFPLPKLRDVEENHYKFWRTM